MMPDNRMDAVGPHVGRRTRVSVLVPLSVASFAALLNSASFGPFVAPIAETLGRPVSTIGYAGTAGLLATAVCGLFIGWLADRFGFRPMLLIGTGLIIAGALVAAASMSFIMFAVARMVSSVGFTAVSGLPNAMIVSRFTGEQRRRGLAWISVASVLAGLVGPPALTFVADLFTWRAAFVTVAIVSGIATIGVIVAVSPIRHDSERAGRAVSLGEAYRALLGSSPVVRLFGASMLQMGGHIGSMIYLGAYLVDGTGMDLRLVGVAFGIQGLGGIAGSFLAGRVGQGNPVAAYAVALVTLAMTLVLIFGLGVSHSLIMVLMFLNGLSQLYAWLTIIHVLARVTPAPQGATMVINGSMLGIGGAAGATLGGLVIVPWGYEVLGMLYPAALVLSAAVFATLRDKISD